MPIPVNTGGLHPTTVSCLEALQWLKTGHRFTNILDLGCGNGILSLFSAEIWQAAILAADISPQAVADATARAAPYPSIRVVRSDAFTHPAIAAAAPYDLLIFNLLAEPIIRFAPLVASHLAPGGACILSGILTWLGKDVLEVYRHQGFELLQTFEQPSWQTFILRRGG